MKPFIAVPMQRVFLQTAAKVHCSYLLRTVILNKNEGVRVEQFFTERSPIDRRYTTRCCHEKNGSELAIVAYDG